MSLSSWDTERVQRDSGGKEAEGPTFAKCRCALARIHRGIFAVQSLIGLLPSCHTLIDACCYTHYIIEGQSLRYHIRYPLHRMMLDDFERACATPNMTFSQRKTVLALSPSLLQPVCHAFGALEQADPPSLHPAIDRAPPVKPFVKSSASPLPLSPSLPLPIGPIHMESCERLKIFKVIPMCMSLPSSLEPGMTSEVPLLRIRCIRQDRLVQKRLETATSNFKGELLLVSKNFRLHASSTTT